MWLTLNPPFHNSATIEKLGNPSSHDYNYSKLNRNKDIKSTKFKNEIIILTLVPKFKKELSTHDFFFHKIKCNIRRKINITREKTFSLDLCYFFCARNLHYHFMGMSEAVSWSLLANLWGNVIEHSFLKTTKNFSEKLPLKHVANRCRLITQLINIIP